MVPFGLPNTTWIEAGKTSGDKEPFCRSRVKPRLPPWGPHVRFRRLQTLVREGSPLVKLRNSA
jgi:hypothetical protein